ncbi:MAG: hypothetical protein KID00_16565 [Clostridium argentinense]|nr:hypothetical protein [Clostridium argentinense]
MKKSKFFKIFAVMAIVGLVSIDKFIEIHGKKKVLDELAEFIKVHYIIGAAIYYLNLFWEVKNANKILKNIKKKGN